MAWRSVALPFSRALLLSPIRRAILDLLRRAVERLSAAKIAALWQTAERIAAERMGQGLRMKFCLGFA